MRAKKLGEIAGVVVVLALAGSAMAQTPSLTIIEPAPTYTSTNLFGGLARGGSAAAGASVEMSPGSPSRGLGMRWNASGGREDIPAFGQANAISQDGNTLLTEDGQLWDPVNGIRSTNPAPSGRTFNPQAGRPSVGNNGSWIISTFRGSGSSVVPFKWTPSTGWQNMPGQYSLNTNIFDATPDGNSWIGETGDFGGGSQFVYRNNAWETLSFQPRAMSDNANTLVGYRLVGSGINYRAILLNGAVETELPVLAGFDRGAIATDVSNDGRTVVGRVFTADGQRADAFIWREGVGMQLLRELTSGFPSDTFDTRDISCDASGLVVSGTIDSLAFGGVRGFVVTIPTPGFVTSAFILCVSALRRKRK